MLARPRRPHRRLQAVPGADAAFCVLALVASTHGAVRVLEQAVCAAVGAVALRVGVRGMWTRTRVFLGYTWTFAGIPGFYLQVAHALVFEYIIHIHEYRQT